MNKSSNLLLFGLVLVGIVLVILIMVEVSKWIAPLVHPNVVAGVGLFVVYLGARFLLNFINSDRS